MKTVFYLCLLVIFNTIEAGNTSSILSTKGKFRNALLEQDFKKAETLMNDLLLDIPRDNHTLFGYTVKFGDEHLLSKFLERLEQKDKDNFSSYLTKHIRLEELAQISSKSEYSTLSALGNLLLTHETGSTKVDIKNLLKKTIKTLDHGVVPEQILWNRSGTYIITMDFSTIKVWNGVKPWNLLHTITDDKGRRFLTVECSPNSQSLAVATLDNKICVYTTNGQLTMVLDHNFSTNIEWINDTKFASYGPDITYLWNTENSESLRIPADIRSIHFQKKLFIKPQEQGFDIYDWHNNRQCSLKHQGQNGIAQWSPQGMHIISIRKRYDGSVVKVWDAAGTLLSSYYTSIDVTKVCWNPQGNTYFLIGSSTIEIRNLQGMLVEKSLTSTDAYWLYDGNGFYTIWREERSQHTKTFYRLYQPSSTILEWAISALKDGEIRVTSTVIKLYDDASNGLNPRTLDGFLLLAHSVKQTNPTRYTQLLAIAKELIERKALIMKKELIMDYLEEGNTEDLFNDSLNIKGLKAQLLKLFPPKEYELELSIPFYEMFARILWDKLLKSSSSEYPEFIEKEFTHFKQNNQDVKKITEEHIETIFGSVQPPLHAIRPLIAYYLKDIERDSLYKGFCRDLSERLKGSTWSRIKRNMKQANENAWRGNLSPACFEPH